MTHSLLRQRARQARGQTLLLFAFLVVVLILFTGLAIDFGLAYVTKAQLSKALDAAALAGVHNLTAGNRDDIARSAFALNYGSPGRDTGPVTPIVTLVTNPTTGQRRLQVSATTTINTFFIRVLPQWRTLTVSAAAEALRGRLIMSLVLDRSGSMALNGGWSALPPAVDAFIDMFDDAVDKAALITFASAVRVDVPMAQPFKTEIKNHVLRQQNQYVGATFAQGGLSLGYTEILNTPVQSGENPIKVAVFFTDGLTNVINDSLPWCVASTSLNFGGLDSGNAVGFFDPTTGTCVGAKNGSIGGCPGDPCPSTDRFTSQINGSLKSFTRANVTADAQFRALATATAMQQSGIVVYSIGLGNNVDVTFLQEVANDQASPIYNPNLPTGRALIAPTAADLQNVFQVIAADILSRLTR
jgi:Flp pilus assembly protein TadG